MSEWKDGLPPVGEWCFGESEAGVEFECFIVATHTSGDSRVVVFRYEDGELEAATDGNAYAFRPLKPEAELKREKAVEEMLELDPYAPELKMLSRRDFCNKLHDAGYRKVNALTDEQIKERFGFDLKRFHAAAWARAAIMGEES